MINKLIGGAIALVVGVNLLPVLNDVISPLTGTGGDFEATAAGTMLDLVPLMFVIILVAFTVALIPSRKG